MHNIQPTAYRTYVQTERENENFQMLRQINVLSKEEEGERRSFRLIVLTTRQAEDLTMRFLMPN